MPSPIRTTLAVLFPFALLGIGLGLGRLVVHSPTEGLVGLVAQNAAAEPPIERRPADAAPDARKPAVARSPAEQEPVVVFGGTVQEPSKPAPLSDDQRDAIRQVGHETSLASDRPNATTPRPKTQQSAAATEPKPTSEDRAHVESGRLKRAAARQPQYKIGSGTYRQKLAPGADARYLVVKSVGRGQLVLHFSGLSALAVGANKVVIDTTWEVDEPNRQVTFTLTGGSPRKSYEAVLAFALDRVTQFDIDDFQEDSLVLRRVRDGESFDWRREPL